eukprot:gene32328-biopygen25711
MDRLAHKCVSLQFLVEMNERVVQPYRPTMTVKEVVEEIIIPATKEKGCSFIDQLWPNMYVAPHAFISHAFGNRFTIIVESLKSYFKDAVFAEIGSTPIEKLVLLTHGFGVSELGQAYAKIDASAADCWAQSDKDMIREHIRTMMIEQKIVDSLATVTEALT